ncbi:agmatinase [Longimicrobium terrae]|uniref:Agmatinase n=1 Tax=Longimicrobium terrae TaxID=1639882 RepID=A0A841H7D9_9BACT|nr:agmatinase [Longimicrobium terrae]MBB4639472.1 agmatinase [Longimicrobium terrae]MBB6073844.1 agmatinase [Longimicrobium terrae]NNC32521.1 agmatinase [Longimicrobium terrae]
MPAELPESLKDLSWELPRNFLGLEGDDASWEKAGVVILPIPYESTVSYQGGTKLGPDAIIQASRFIELYDQELDTEPGPAIGVCTLPALHLTSAGPEAAVAELREAYDAILREAGDRFVIGLGGEHSITSAPVLAYAARQPEGRKLSVLQFDAHGDLRMEYEGSAYSHAAVMARIIDTCDLVQVGIRAITSEERALIREREGNITTIFADEMWDNEAWIERALAALGDDVFITFDVDYFDPSLMPATGTPEPGGITWYPTMKLLRRVFETRNVVGADVVELAPIGGNAAPDFVVAKLVHKMVAYRTLAANRG